MTSTDGQVNGNGLVALALVVGFVVAGMIALGVVDGLARAWGF